MLTATPLVQLDTDYSPEIGLYGAPFAGPGYHSRVVNGTRVHGTRENLYRAVELLDRGEEAAVARGLDVVRIILGLQDQDPISTTYGIWSWLYEEPLAEMDRPDWNWADFLGLPLAKILVVHADLLPADLREQIEASLRHAALSIFRRNVGAGYTNIAIKGACVAAAAGELIGMPWLVDYGRLRLASVVDSVRVGGGFREFNSPTYTRLVMDICETSLRIITDPGVRAEIELIRCLEWEFTATHYHPGTQQFVGPQSRAYADFLSTEWLDFIGARTGLWTPQTTPAKEMLPCPPHLVERFARLPENRVEATIQHFLREGDSGQGTQPFSGHIWLVPEACLGSMCDGTFWNQSRPVLGYWNNAEGRPVALRLRMLKDGRDFASGYVWNCQLGSRVLSLTNFLTDGGDFHIHLNRPEDGVFAPCEIALCYELHGHDCIGTQLDADTWELGAGDWKAVVRTPAADIDGLPLQWSLRTEAEMVSLRGVYPATESPFVPSALTRVNIVTALEVVRTSDTGGGGPIVTEPGPGAGTWLATWRTPEGELAVEGPLAPLPLAKVAHFGKVHAEVAAI